MPTTIFVTHYVDVPVTHYVDITYNVNETDTRTFVEDVTEVEITTLQYTDLITETDLKTLSFTETDLETMSITTTDMETVTSTKTEVDFETITKTAVLTSFDPCPSTCSMYGFALIFWSLCC